MKRWMQYLIIVAGCFSMTGCMGCSRVSPGYVGVKSTLAGSSRGMQDAAVGPAWVFYNPFTASVLEYPTFVQTAVWTHNKDEGHPVNEEVTFTNKDSMQIAVDISIAYSLAPDKVPAFYLKFRSDDLQSFTDGFLRNLTRQHMDEAAGHYAIEQIMGDNSTFLAEARNSLQKELDPIGVRIEQFGLIGAPRPPQTVIDSINGKMQAIQLAMQKQNELASSEADAKKRIAAADGEAQSILRVAQAQAQANELLSKSLTPMLVENKKLDKWDGKLPQVQSGNSGGIILDLNK